LLALRAGRLLLFAEKRIGIINFMNAEITTPATSVPEVPSIREHIVITPGTCGGKPRIAGHRIKVQQIVIDHYRLGISLDDIVAQHSGVTLADVHAALAYYHDHREQIDTDINEGERLYEELKKSQPSIVEKARQRIAERNPKESGGS
jgi:uncharacterized protein (DUF433 family)